MDFSASSIAAGLLFGLIGWYLFKHGRRETHYPSVFIGVALMVYPYFIENTYLLWGIGAGLCITAYQLIR